MTMHSDDRDSLAVADAVITAMFNRRARRSDGADLRGPILRATSSIGQTGTLRARLLAHALPESRRGFALLALAALVLAALAVIGSGAMRRDSSPKLTAPDFVLPFEYRLPVGSGLREASGGPTSNIISWIVGPDAPAVESARPQLYGGQQPESGNVRGIVVAAGGSAWTHSSTGRFLLRSAPADLVADLRDKAEVAYGPSMDSQVDGQAAVSVRTGPQGDIHVSGELLGLTGNHGYFLLNTPGRLTVTEIAGSNVFVLAWTRSPSDLDAWMPVADEFIRSIHFLQEGR